MIPSYLVEAAQYIEHPLVKLCVLLLAGWAGFRFCDWLFRT